MDIMDRASVLLFHYFLVFRILFSKLRCLFVYCWREETKKFYQMYINVQAKLSQVTPKVHPLQTGVGCMPVSVCFFCFRYSFYS